MNKQSMLNIEDFQHDYARFVIRFDPGNVRNTLVIKHIDAYYEHIKIECMEWLKTNYPNDWK